MRLKKFLFLLLALFCSCCVCSARGVNDLDKTIEKSELCLGGITIDMPYQSVVKMYGEPQWKYGNPNNGIAMYGDTVRIGFDKNIVTYVLVMADNGWKTPKGISVGMTLDDVYKAYGMLEISEKGAKGDYVVYHYVRGPERIGQELIFESKKLYVSCDLSKKITSLEIYSSSPNREYPGHFEHYY